MIVHIRVVQAGGDGVLRLGELALALLGQGLPLAGRLFEANVAVCGDAVAVHEDAHAGLVPGGVDVVKRHHVYARIAEVARGDVEQKAGILCHFL